MSYGEQSEMGAPKLLDVFERRLRLEGHLITRTGLHIGAGGSGDPIGTDLPVVRDGLGRPMIPGSSLKGVMRSAAEALLRHFPRPAKGAPPEEHPALWSCDLVGGDPCIDHEWLKKERQALPDRPPAGSLRQLAEKAWRHSCPVCRLFGSMAMAGRVRFPDLLLAPEQAPMMEVRNGVGIDRDKGQAANGVLYDFEAVPPQTRFELSVIVDNYDDFEIGLLLYLFDELNRGALSLGGKSTRGLGQVAIEWKQLEEVSAAPKAGAANPFADLLRRECFREAEAPVQVELPIPPTGEPDLWRKLAEALEGAESIEEGDLRRISGDLDLSKAQAKSRLGVESSRQPWGAMLRALIGCGRLVERDGRVVSKAKLDEERAASAETARTPAWMLPLYERFLGAMDALWTRTTKEAA